MKEGGKADKTDWFKKLGKDVTVTVPASVDSKLSQLVREGLEQFQEGEKYLVLEDGGRSLHQDLVKSNFNPMETCERANCLTCWAAPSNGKCYKSNVGYRVSCAREPCTLTGAEPQQGHGQLDQLDDGTDDEGDALQQHQYHDLCPPPGAQYEGETARTAFTRGQQHLKLYRGSRKEKEKSFMWHHTQQVHGGVLGDQGEGLRDYKMEVVGRFRDPLSRILDEAIRIKDAETKEKNVPVINQKKIVCLNSKLDFFKSQAVHTTFSKGAKK